MQDFDVAKHTILYLKPLRKSYLGVGIGAAKKQKIKKYCYSNKNLLN